MENTHKNLPRDVFLYLLSIITLAATAVSLGILFFQYINIYFPDILGGSSYLPSVLMYKDTIRNTLAVLIVVFPVYAWVLRFLNKDLVKNPEKRELKIRKWLLYLTLFVAAIVIIVDLIVVLRGFLQGELTSRFIFKAASIMVIAFSVLYYYFKQLKDHLESPPLTKNFAKVIFGIIIATILFGFYVAGLPQNQRTTRLDEMRISDLQTIQSQTIEYWRTKGRLPKNLDELKSDTLGIVLPLDPESRQPYEYAVLGSLKFRICADFKTSNMNSLQDRMGEKSVPLPVGASDPYYSGLQYWQHDLGNTCFERTIDPGRIQLYNPTKI